MCVWRGCHGDFPADPFRVCGSGDGVADFDRLERRPGIEVGGVVRGFGRRVLEGRAAAIRNINVCTEAWVLLR